MGYLIFRGVSSASLGDVYISKMPSHKKAAMRNTEYRIKGRDGVLHVDEGFDEFKIQATIILIKGAAGKRQIVNAWADGTGKLVTSDDLTHAYRATVKDEIVWKRVYANNAFYDTAQITWTCEPYMYEATDTVVEMTQSGALLNPGSAEALPMIRVDGSGDCVFSVAGYDITLSGVTANVPVYIDCETGYVYTASGASSMVGEFPVLPMGQSAVVITSGVTKLTITPHWRWV